MLKFGFYSRVSRSYAKCLTNVASPSVGHSIGENDCPIVFVPIRFLVNVQIDIDTGVTSFEITSTPPPLFWRMTVVTATIIILLLQIPYFPFNEFHAGNADGFRAQK